MDKLLNQFKRIYSDDGRGDIDFTELEGRLREAQARLTGATQELARAAQNLNRAALSADMPKVKH